jgi:hypothetical protein
MDDGAWEQISAAVRIAEGKKACETPKARPAYASQINGHAIVDNPRYQAFQYSKRRNRTPPSPVG